MASGTLFYCLKKRFIRLFCFAFFMFVSLANSLLADDLNLIRFSQAGKFGFINNYGEIIIEPLYDDAPSFLAPNGVAAVRKDNKWFLINSSGDIIVETEYKNISAFGDDGLAIYWEQGKAGYINTAGEKIIEASYSVANLFGANGLAAISDDGFLYGYIDRNGKIIIKPRFFDAYRFNSENVAVVQNETGLWAAINEKGEYLFSPKFVFLSDFGKNNIAAALDVNSRFGYVDVAGNWIFPPVKIDDLAFDCVKEAFYVDSGLFVFFNDRTKKWGYVNKIGNWVIDARYDGACAFNTSGSQSLATVLIDSDRAVINKKAETILRTNDGARLFLNSSGVTMSDNLGGQTYFNSQGQRIFSLETHCGVDIAKNSSGDIVWPKAANIEDLCEGRLLSVQERDRIYTCLTGIKPGSEWLRDFLYYKGAVNCLYDDNKAGPAFDDLSPVVAISGLNIDVRKDFNTSKSFKKRAISQSSSDYIHFNPAIAIWAAKNFLNRAQISEKNYQDGKKIYEDNKYLIRSFFYAYEYLTKYKNINQEAESYEQAAYIGEAEGSLEVFNYLSKHNPDPRQNYDTNQYEYSTLEASSGFQSGYSRFRFGVGFWLRRHLDGSIDAVAKLMLQTIAQFDSEWHAQHKL